MWASPTTAQLLAIASLVVLCFALAFVGPDYINVRPISDLFCQLLT